MARWSPSSSPDCYRNRGALSATLALAPGPDVGYDGLTVSDSPLTSRPTTINPPPGGGSGGGGTGSGGGGVGGPRPCRGADLLDRRVVRRRDEARLDLRCERDAVRFALLLCLQPVGGGL